MFVFMQKQMQRIKKEKRENWGNLFKRIGCARCIKVTQKYKKEKYR